MRASTSDVRKPEALLPGRLRVGWETWEATIIDADEIGDLGHAFNRMADQIEKNTLIQNGLIGQLEQKNTELERFTYTVSHELKTPLVTVTGFLGHLGKDLKAGNQERIQYDMDQIRTAIKTINRQLEDLLELSRLGRVMNPRVRFSMATSCQEALEVMRGIVEEYDAGVVIDENMPEVFADPDHIREVLQNLIENGIKF